MLTRSIRRPILNRPFTVVGRKYTKKQSNKTNKQYEIEPLSNLLDIIQRDTFEDPMKTALFIEFTVKNEISIAFGKDFEKVDELFIHYLDKNITEKELEKIKIEDINYYYAYLYERFHEIVELYATYDYLLCFAYHLRHAFQHDIVLSRSSRSFTRKTRKSKLLDKIKGKNILISNSVPNPNRKLRSERLRNKTLGGMKKYLYEQCDFLSYINRSFWAKMGSGILTAAGAALSTIGCSIYAPFIYDKCSMVLDNTLCDNYSIIGPSTMDTLASSGMLSTSVSYGAIAGIASIGTLSLMQGITRSAENEVVFPNAQVSEGIFNRDPVNINAVTIPDRAGNELIEPTLESDQLLSELAKFNACIINDKFIGSSSLTKFRKILRDSIIVKLKTIMNEKIEETVAILKRKLLTTKAERIITSRNENPEINSTSIVKQLEDNKANLRISPEEMIQIEMEARSKVSGYIIDQANFRLRDEIAKGIAGFEKIKEENISIMPVNQELMPEENANSIRDNIITILASIAHIEMENGYILDQKTVNSIIYFYYFYLIGLYLYKTLEKPNKSRSDYSQIVIMFILFLYLLLLTSQNLGFDPINIEEIRRNNTIVDTKKNKVFKSKLEAFRSRQSAIDTANTTNTTNIPTTLDNISNTTKITYFESFFDKTSWVDSAVKTEELLYDPNISTSVPFIEKQIVDDYTKCHTEASKSYISSDLSKRWCDIYQLGSKAMNSLFWTRLLMHQMISKFALSDIMLQLADGSVGSNIKIAFLSTYAGLKFACTKYKTIGSIGCLVMSSRSIIKNYRDFKSRKRLRISNIETSLTPFEFRMDSFLKIIDDDVNEGGGLRMRQGLQSLTASLEQMVKYNQEIQTALNTLNVDIGTKVQIGQLKIGERRLEIEEKRIEKENVENVDNKEAVVGDIVLPAQPSGDPFILIDLEKRLKDLAGEDLVIGRDGEKLINDVKKIFNNKNPNESSMFTLAGGSVSSKKSSKKSVPV
jgi:hypothetical protein